MTRIWSTVGEYWKKISDAQTLFSHQGKYIFIQVLWIKTIAWRKHVRHFFWTIFLDYHARGISSDSVKEGYAYLSNTIVPGRLLNGEQRIRIIASMEIAKENKWKKVRTSEQSTKAKPRNHPSALFLFLSHSHSYLRWGKGRKGKGDGSWQKPGKLDLFCVPQLTRTPTYRKNKHVESTHTHSHTHCTNATLGIEIWKGKNNATLYNT